MNTYLTVYEDEQRAVELTIRDNDDVAYTPDSATYTIKDSNGVEIVAETTCMVDENKIYFMVTDTVTALPGEYEVIWKITKVSGANTYIFHHKTKLTVEEL